MNPDMSNLEKARGSKPEMLSSEQVVNLLIGISHATWMKQARRPGTKYADIPQEEFDAKFKNSFDNDRDRARDAMRILERYKPKTRQIAIDLVTASSHNQWVEDQIGRVGSSIGKIDFTPKDHDSERAEDIVNALEIAGVLSFES